MSKITTIALICALLTVTAMADTITLSDDFSGVFQTQASTNGIGNLVLLEHGDVATSSAILTVSDGQIVTGQASQTSDTDLWQLATSTADCGIVQVTQELGNTSTQYQVSSDCCGSKIQGQTTSLAGEQVSSKVEGYGTSTAFQTAITSDNQMATNSLGTAIESVDVTSVQYSSVSGQAGTASTVGSAVSSTTTQLQYVY